MKRSAMINSWFRYAGVALLFSASLLALANAQAAAEDAAKPSLITGSGRSVFWRGEVVVLSLSA